MLDRGDLITLNNNKEYIVINQTNFNDKNYVYLVSKDGVSGIAVCLLENDTLTTINDGDLVKLLLEKFRQEQGIKDEWHIKKLFTGRYRRTGY